MPRTISRRRFVQASAAAGATAFWCGLLRAREPNGAASDKLNIAVIGVAGQGEYNLNNVASQNIVALCDVDEGRAAKARERFPQAKFHTDFRRVFEQKGLDAAVIATPDHTHAPAALAALKSGLHVYCEKPLTHTVHEARLVTEAAVQNQRITQLGTQIHAGGNYRRVVELIQANTIGPVHEVHVWVDTSYHGGARRKDTPPVPPGLHYDLWLGPAPERPYHPSHLHFVWRGWWDFGGGALADMACHYMDLPHWALKLRHCEKVAAEGPPAHAEGPPPWLIVHYEYPARDQLPPVKLTWYHGGKRPAAYVNQLPKWGGGVLFVGDKGMLVANYGEHKLLPEYKFKDSPRPKPTIPDSIGHHREWIEACKTGGPTTCSFDYSGVLTETVLLGNVAYRLGRPFTWDAKNLRAVNEPEAERLIRKEYRKGWTL